MGVTKALNIGKKKIYTSLKVSRARGLVTKNRSPFSALPFEEELDLLTKMEKEQAHAMQESKEELLDILETKE